MQQVNWTALNVRLCEALKVPTFTVPSAEIEGLEEVRYPYIISVDALLPLLAARGYSGLNLYRTQEPDGREWWHAVLFGRSRVSDTPGHALALAAAASLGVEVPYVD